MFMKVRVCLQLCVSEGQMWAVQFTLAQAVASYLQHGKPNLSFLKTPHLTLNPLMVNVMGLCLISTGASDASAMVRKLLRLRQCCKAICARACCTCMSTTGWPILSTAVR